MKQTKTDQSNETNSGASVRNNAVTVCCTKSSAFANCSTIFTSGSSGLAEERIGEAADYGVVSYISNSSYLTGRSHPLMRRSLLSNFHAVWIDNLNGDKYRTGKITPKGLPCAGTRDDRAFTTEMDPRGIQPGTAIVTWVKRTDIRTKPGDTA